MATLRSKAIDELAERCLPLCLSVEGYSLYFRHPLRNDTVLVAFETDREVALAKKRELRRMLLSFAGAVLGD